MTPKCPCGQPVDGATLCARCVTTLGYALANIAAYAGDLDIVRSRLARYGSGAAKVTSTGREVPMPVDHRFTDTVGDGTQLEWDTRNTLTTWVRVLRDDHPHTTLPADTPRACVVWLLAMADRIRVAGYGPEILGELCDLELRLRRFVDRPPPKIYLGLCTRPDCVGGVYAHEGAAAGGCDARGCDAKYDVAASRRGLEQELDAKLCTAAEIAGLATYLRLRTGRDQVRKRINTWHTRGRIHPVGHTADGAPLFQYSQVRTLLYRELADTREAGQVASA